MRTVAVLHYPWGVDFGVAELPPRTPRRALRRGLAYRANPRPPGYMEALVADREPGAELVRTSDPGWEDAVRDADRVVLLYPDSIGLGYGALERRLAAAGRAPGAALIGRRRSFALDSPSLRALRARRLLERSLVAELAGLALLAVATPVLVAWDVLRGRR